MFPRGFKGHTTGVEEFNISQIVPDIKQNVRKQEIQRVVNRPQKPSRIRSNRTSQQMKIRIHKYDESSDDEKEPQIIKFDKIKVWVTPNGSRFKKSMEFGDAVGDIFTRNNSDEKENWIDFLMGKLPNFDLEREVNYVPNPSTENQLKPLMATHVHSLFQRTNDRYQSPFANDTGMLV